MFSFSIKLKNADISFLKKKNVSRCTDKNFLFTFKKPYFFYREGIERNFPQIKNYLPTGADPGYDKEGWW